MKIAVIESDAHHVDLLRRDLQHDGWAFEFFYNSVQFGLSNLQEFDVIIADYSIDSISGRDLIHSISKKTRALLFLMSDNTSVFSDDDICNQNISGLINKTDIGSIKQQLEYADIKVRLNGMIEQETQTYKSIVKEGVKNYNIQEKDGVLVIEIKDIINNKNDFTDKIKKSGKSQAVVSFGSDSLITSSLLGELAFVYKTFKNIDGEIVFWNSSKSDMALTVIKQCRMDRIIKLADYFDDAVKFLTKDIDLNIK